MTFVVMTFVVMTFVVELKNDTQWDCSRVVRTILFLLEWLLLMEGEILGLVRLPSGGTLGLLGGSVSIGVKYDITGVCFGVVIIILFLLEGLFLMSRELLGWVRFP